MPPFRFPTRYGASPFFWPRIMSGITIAPRNVDQPDLKRPNTDEGRNDDAMTAGLRGTRDRAA
eukprot:scaffold207549_cov32-Tisochrysis_lutea.AAC.2